MQNKELICVGELSASHGIKGSMKLRSFTEVPADIFNYGELYREDGSVIELKKEGVLNNGAFVVKVSGINNRNEADFIKGTEIFIDRESLPSLDEEDGYYQEDLLGLDVKDKKTKEVIGKVKHVQNFGASDVVEIEFNNKRTMTSFPFTNDIFPDIDLDGGYITFVEPEYLSGK